MKGFISYVGIIIDESMVNKGTLIFSDNVRKQFLNPIISGLNGNFK